MKSHTVKTEMLVNAKTPYGAALMAQAWIRKHGFNKDMTLTNGNKGFKVRWSIELDSPTLEDATKTALEWIRDPEAICNVYEVQNLATKKCNSVDLWEEAGSKVLPLTEARFLNWGF